MQTGEAAPAEGHGSGLASREIHILMIAVMSGMFLAALDGTIVITALPAMVGDLGNLSQAPWIHVGFLLTQTIATPIIGKLSDIYGRKLTFQVAIVVFLALVLSVPGTAREEQVIVPVIGRALPPLCTSKILFNRECPGCGLTRCFISMAHGDLARAWRFNPAGVYFFAVVVAQLPFRAWQRSR